MEGEDGGKQSSFERILPFRELSGVPDAWQHLRRAFLGLKGTGTTSPLRKRISPHPLLILSRHTSTPGPAGEANTAL